MNGMALAHCILGKFLGVVCHCFPPPLDVPTFAARCLYVRNDTRDPSSERWNCGREICPVILPKFRLPRKLRDLLHAANLRHGTDGFTSPPKEGVLRIFTCLYIFFFPIPWGDPLPILPGRCGNTVATGVTIRSLIRHKCS